MRQELKIVVSYKEGTAIVGIQRPDCDPVLTLVEGELEVALDSLKDLMVKAEEVWQEASRYPKAEIPEPPAAAPVSTTTSRPAPAAPTKTTLQQHMF